MDTNTQIKGLFGEIASVALERASLTTVYGDIKYTQLPVTFFAALGLLLLSWLLFEYMARGSSTRILFQQRKFDETCSYHSEGGVDSRDIPPDIPDGKSVLLAVFSIPQDKMLGLMGPGAHLSYRLMRHCTSFASFAMMYAVLVLVPVYICQFHQRSDRSNILTKIAVTHISPLNPSHMWVVVISSYIMCIYWAIVIYSEWQVVKSTMLSASHDSLYSHFQSRYSLLVETRRGSPPVNLRIQLCNILGKGIEEIPIVSTIVDTTSLDALLFKLWITNATPSFLFFRQTKHDSLMNTLRSVVAERERLRSLAKQLHYEAYRDSDVETRVVSTEVEKSSVAKQKSGVGLGDTTVRTTASLFMYLFGLIKTARVPTYFVSLRSMSSKAILTHMYRVHAGSSVSGGDSFARITPAPAPSEIIWGNITVDRNIIVVRKIFTRIVLILCAVLLPFPVVWIQGYARDYKTESSTPGETAEFGSAAWRSELFCLYLPALIQMVLSQTIPRVLRMVSLYYERYKTYKDVSKYVLHRTLLFQLLTIYIIVFGDLWVELSNTNDGILIMFDSILVRFRRLGHDIPPVAHYFASTVILSLLTETAVEMLLPAKVLIGLFEKYVKNTPNPWANCGKVQFRHSSSMASYISLLSIMFTFSLISPVIVLFCWCFWAFSYVWNTYAFIYLNNRQYEVGASFAPTIYSSVMTTLIASQFALFIVVWSADSSKWKYHISGQVSAFALIIILLILFKYVVMGNFIIHSGDSTSLSLSAEVDRRQSSDQMFSDSYYIQPELEGDNITRDIVLPSLEESPIHVAETEYLINSSI